MIPRVAGVIASLERFMATVGDAMAVPRDAGQFMHALILATGAKSGLEIGTSYGYSGLWITSALAENGGMLVTIDHEERKSEAARGYFETAGLAAHVDLRVGTALDVLETLAGPFDFVLSDADKENCRRYVELVTDKLTDRAVVVTDNITTHETQLAEFMAWIRRHGDFCSTSVPVGNGMELSIKRAGRKRR